MTQETERELFEAEFSKIQPEKSLKRWGDDYWSPVAQLAWEIWQARASLESDQKVRAVLDSKK